LHTKSHYTAVIEQLDFNHKLNAYNPTPIGTPPLNIDIESSDIDIACTAEKLVEFETVVSKLYSHHSNYYSDYFRSRGNDGVRVSFIFDNWEIELFCQSIPVEEQ